MTEPNPNYDKVNEINDIQLQAMPDTPGRESDQARPTSAGIHDINLPGADHDFERNLPSQSNAGKSRFGFGAAAGMGVVVVAVVAIIILASGGAPAIKEAPAPEMIDIQFEETNFQAFEKGRRQEGMVMAAMDEPMIAKRMAMIPLPPQNSGRYLGHIATDKPFYKPNENVFIETWVVDSLNKTPRFQEEQMARGSEDYRYIPQVQSTFQVLDAFDKEVYQSKSQNLGQGTVMNQWKIAANQKGGEYNIKVSFSGVYPNIPETYRKIRIGTYEQPDLFVTVDFEQNSYSPGDKVEAKIKVRRPDGERLPVGSSVAISATNVVKQANIELNFQGEAEVNFQIPSTYKLQVLTLSVKSYLGYTQEKQSAAPFVSSHSVVMTGEAFKVQFYPDFSGAYLVQNVINKVYFEVLSDGESGLPQPLTFTKAVLSKADDTAPNGQKIIIDTILEKHNGRSFFEFIPNGRIKYMLTVFRDGKTPQVFVVPKVDPYLTAQATLADSGVFGLDTKAILCKIETNRNFKKTKDSKLVVQINMKEELVWQQDIEIEEAGASSSKLNIPVKQIYKRYPNGGVFIFKVLDKSIAPVIQATDSYPRDGKAQSGRFAPIPKPAPQKPEKGSINLERLIFLKPMDMIKFKFSTGRTSFQPGDEVDLNLSVAMAGKDEQFYTSIVVTDTSSFLKVPKYKQAPSVPAMVYLEKELRQPDGQVNEFQYSDEYIDSIFNPLLEASDSKGYNLDILLAIQGWRRLLLDDISKLESKISSMESGNDKLILEYLNGKQGQRRYYKGDDEMIAFAMGAADDGDGRMEKDAIAPNQRTVTKPKVPAKKPNPEDPVAIGEGEVAKVQDFQLVKPGQKTYSHQLRKGWAKFDPRQDFTQTLMYNSGQPLELSRTRIFEYGSRFFLNDQVSSFVVTVNVFSNKGKFGYLQRTIVSSKMTYSQFTMPSTLISGDALLIPIQVFNNRDESQTIKVGVEQTIQDMIVPTEYKVQVNPNSSGQVTHPLVASAVGYTNVQVTLTVDGKAQDILKRQTSVVQDGFPQQISRSNVIEVVKKGVVSTQDDITESIILPKTLLGSPSFKVTVYSTPLDSILDALKSLIRKPYGCFEQTSSTTYPMVMALQLLREFKKQYVLKGDKSKIAEIEAMEKEILENLQAGYKKLINFETTSKGYEWFGKAPGHEALTSYGLGQFQEMKQVADFVDDDAIQRNKDWVLSRRKTDGTGGFQLNPKQLDTFGKASQDVTDFYITWILSKEKDQTQDTLAAEIKNVQKVMSKTKDTYLRALAALIYHNVGMKDQAKITAKLLVAQQQETGEIIGAESSITNSRGNNLLVETTALVTMAWINVDKTVFREMIDKSVGYIMKQAKDGGRFGSTQATVLSLQALVKYSTVVGGVSGKGNFVLYMNGEKIDSIQFSETEALGKIDFSEKLQAEYLKTKPTAIELNLKVEGYVYNSAGDGFSLNTMMQADFQDKMPTTAKKPLISFAVEADTPVDQLTKVGQTQIQKISVVNTQDKAQGMAVGILSVPSCMSVDQTQLELLKDAGSIDNFEVSADNTLITLYWTYLKANQEEQVQITRVRQFAGKSCISRANQAYLYYDDDQVVWIK